VPITMEIISATPGPSLTDKRPVAGSVPISFGKRSRALRNMASSVGVQCFRFACCLLGTESLPTSFRPFPSVGSTGGVSGFGACGGVFFAATTHCSRSVRSSCGPTMGITGREGQGAASAPPARWLAQPSLKMHAKNSEFSVSSSHVEVQSTGWLTSAESAVCRSSSNPTPRKGACMAAALPADIQTGESASRSLGAN